MIVLVTGHSDPRLMEGHKMAGMHRSVRGRPGTSQTLDRWSSIV